MIETVLCDDMLVLLDKLETQLTEIAAQLGEDIHIRKFTSGEELVFHLEEHPEDADVIFLDVLMKKLNGIETARQLRRFGCHAEIIFLTSTMDYVFDSFDVEPLHYLVKNNVSTAKLREVFSRALEHVKENVSQEFTLTVNRETRRIPIKDISYFEIVNRIVTIHFRHTSLDFYSSMERLETELRSHGFIRTHRSFLVNPKYIEKFSTGSITLLDGTVIPVGPNYSSSVKNAFTRSFFR